MGDNYINPLSTVHELKEFVMYAKRELCQLDSLRKILVVVLVKVLEMRLWNEDVGASPTSE